MLKIGITGGIGSGKSTVCSIFESLGVPVFKADEEGRRILATNENVKQEVVKLFGADVLTNNFLDRKKIAEIVFTDKGKLSQLNSIIHPKVREAFLAWSNQQNTLITAEEAAIIFESGTYKILDKVIVVTAPEKLRIERVVKRDNITEAAVRGRMQNQWTEEEKVQHADFIITNDGQLPLIPQALAIYNQLVKLAK